MSSQCQPCPVETFWALALPIYPSAWKRFAFAFSFQTERAFVVMMVGTNSIFFWINWNDEVTPASLQAWQDTLRIHYVTTLQKTPNRHASLRILHILPNESALDTAATALNNHRHSTKCRTLDILCGSFMLREKPVAQWIRIHGFRSPSCMSLWFPVEVQVSIMFKASWTHRILHIPYWSSSIPSSGNNIPFSSIAYCVFQLIHLHLQVLLQRLEKVGFIAGGFHALGPNPWGSRAARKPIYYGLMLCRAKIVSAFMMEWVQKECLGTNCCSHRKHHKNHKLNGRVRKNPKLEETTEDNPSAIVQFGHPVKILLVLDLLLQDGLQITGEVARFCITTRIHQMKPKWQLICFGPKTSELLPVSHLKISKLALSTANLTSRCDFNVNSTRVEQRSKPLWRYDVPLYYTDGFVGIPILF